MKFTAKVIADFLKGEIVGNPDIEVNNISKIEEGEEGTLSFLANPKYEKYLYTTNASIVLVNKDLVLEKEVNATLVKVDNAYDSFASLLQLYEEGKPKKTGINKLAFIDESASVGNDVFIDAYAYIGENVTIENNVKIYAHAYIGDNTIVKDNTTIFSGVKIYHECQIGNNCCIHAGTIIGADGFGFAPQSENDYKKIPQIGNVIIEDNVDIGANATIDRATIGSTIIHKGVKIDNLVQIAHNVEVGENTVIVSQAGIAGSTKIGKNCMIAGQVGIVGHLTIADGTKIAAQSGVSNNITNENTIVLGSPAWNILEARKSIAVYRKLPELYKQIANLQKEIDNLKTK